MISVCIRSIYLSLSVNQPLRFSIAVNMSPRATGSCEFDFESLWPCLQITLVFERGRGSGSGLYPTKTTYKKAQQGDGELNISK